MHKTFLKFVLCCVSVTGYTAPAVTNSFFGAPVVHSTDDIGNHRFGRIVFDLSKDRLSFLTGTPLAWVPVGHGVARPGSMLRLSASASGNQLTNLGMGSEFRFYSNVDVNTGQGVDYNYTSDSTYGDSITILQKGAYSISASDASNVALVVKANVAANFQYLSTGSSGGGSQATASATVFLNEGEILQVFALVNAPGETAQFILTRVHD